MSGTFNTLLLCWKDNLEKKCQSFQNQSLQLQTSDCLSHVTFHSFDSTRNGDITENIVGSETSDSSSSISWEPEEGSEQEAHLETLCFQLTGDNLDISIKTKYMTIDRRNKSLHWFNMIATNERIVDCHLPTARPRCSILSVPDTAFLPSLDDHAYLRKEFAIMVERIITKYMPGFSHFAKYVVNHIEHQYTKQASKKSIRNCLGLLEFNENKQQDMVKILEHVNQTYVPYSSMWQDESGRHTYSQPFVRMQFGGDQLTVERIRSSQLAVINGATSYERLERVFTHAGHFHCSMNFVNLIFTKFYDTQSTKDVGTLYQLRNRLDRRDIGRDTHKRYRSCRSFVNDVLDGYILAAAVTHFKLKDFDDSPVPPGMPKSLEATWFHGEVLSMVDKYVLQWIETKKHASALISVVQSGFPEVTGLSESTVVQPSLTTVPSCNSVPRVRDSQQIGMTPTSLVNLAHQSASLRSYRGNLWSLLGRLKTLQVQRQQTSSLPVQTEIACAVMSGEQHAMKSLYSDSRQCSVFTHVESESQHSMQQQQHRSCIEENEAGFWLCRDPECTLVFRSKLARCEHESNVHLLLISDNDESNIDQTDKSHDSTTAAEDKVFNYFSNFLKTSLLERDFEDAVSEMDGERLLRLWKFKFLHFKETRRTKYALEAFCFVADQMALLSCSEAHRQLWNRGFNMRGGIGNNIPLDLMVEHNNNIVKELIANQGANVSFASAQLVSRASQGVEAVLDNLDMALQVHRESGNHARIDKQKDVRLIANEALRQNMSAYSPGRAYKTFTKMNRDVLQGLTPSSLLTWIRKQKQKLHGQEVEHPVSNVTA